ncbi:MAG: RNA polymerase sigma factor [Candidatus Magasanikbacteria bacterium]|nr:RNA polymerase sigma factor [Candidatus Magasanikbacteria bacterium]
MRVQITEKILLYKVVTKADPVAYGKLYDLYVAKIYRFIFLKVRTKEDAEDITNEVFLKTWEYIIKRKKNVEVIRSFSGLVYRIARNSIVDHYRKKSRINESANYLMEEFPNNRDNLREIELKQDIAHTFKLLRKMKQEYQEVVLLRYTEELSIKEISDILGKRPTAVRVTLHRALKKLKQLAEKLPH